MKIAVEGCAHGELDAIYATIAAAEKEHGIKVDLLLICGDFQAIRNQVDLTSLACPPRYRALGTFHQYYAGKKRAPVPTIFIGGNHESSAYMLELLHGGWAAENVYYLGKAGVLRVGGVRIAGSSGIYKDHDFQKGYHERVPFGNDAMRSVYHVRDFEIKKLSMITGDVDIFLSHDWPRGIEQHGDVNDLLRKKKFLEREVRTRTLGNPGTELLLAKLQPSYWFAAHMHVKYPALVRHPLVEDNVKSDGHAHVAKTTRFLALDKCIPGRDFLQILDVPSTYKYDPLQPNVGPVFEYDPDWLAVTRALDEYMSFGVSPKRLPDAEELERRVFREREWVAKNIPSLAIPLNFAPSGPVQLNIEHKFNQKEWREAARAHVNPQTEAFCLMLGIPNRINVDGAMDDSTREPAAAGNPDEIAIDDTSDGEECEDAVRSKRALSNEIKLESVDDVVTGSTHVDTSEQ